MLQMIRWGFLLPPFFQFGAFSSWSLTLGWIRLMGRDGTGWDRMRIELLKPQQKDIPGLSDSWLLDPLFFFGNCFFLVVCVMAKRSFAIDFSMAIWSYFFNWLDHPSAQSIEALPDRSDVDMGLVCAWKAWLEPHPCRTPLMYWPPTKRAAHPWEGQPMVTPSFALWHWGFSAAAAVADPKLQGADVAGGPWWKQCQRDDVPPGKEALSQVNNI